MSVPDSADFGKSNGTPKPDPNVIFAVLNNRARRRLLFALSKYSPQSAADLMHIGAGDCNSTARHNYLDSTLKNLNVLIDAGLVGQLEDPQEGRRWLYALNRGVNVTVEGDRRIFDFEYIVARISPDGD